MLRHPLRVAVLLSTSTLAWVAGCGGKRGTITLTMVTSPGHDPFASTNSASNVRFTIGTVQKTSAITNGSFTFDLEEKPPKTSSDLVVEVLEADNTTVVGYGRTPPISLTAGGQNDTYGVWVGIPGTIAPISAVLASPRTDLAGAAAVGLGALFAGGRSTDGTASSAADLFDVYTSDVITSTVLTTPVASAAAIPSAPDIVIYSGSTAAAVPGGDSTADPVGTGQLFDPSSGGTGLWVNVSAVNQPAPTSHATTAVLGDGSGLVTGGANPDGTPNNSATIITTGGTVSITPFFSTATNALFGMQAPRLHHAVAAAPFASGDGALIVGGLADGDTQSPVVEKLSASTFSAQPVMGMENRWYATATPVMGGVLVVGGTTGTGTARVATSSVVYIPTSPAGNPMTYDFTSLGMSARARHTATLVGNDILLCGGVDETNTQLVTCDVLATNGAAISYKRKIGGAVGRINHVAAQLETGIVLLAGGENQQGAPLDSIDIYTPDADEIKVIAAIEDAAAAAASTTTTTTSSVANSSSKY